ncbi:MAG: acyl-ACP--UDP-N-acetylglucosamine O-acyltransferase [Nitrospinota bacterium]|nr:acyl-ACP--UDP-N-acetylglucosamine O-acyltransferase [Nitrospinota bacterium]
MNISKNATIDPSAVLGDNVTVGPYTTIGPDVHIGAGTVVGPNALIEKGTVIGENCRIYHGASLGGDPQIVGFKDVPSFVHIGNGTTIREFVTVQRSGHENGITKIGNHCMLMNYAHVAHDCDIGNHVIVVNSTGLAGHIVVEDYAFISGFVAVHQFVRIGTNSMIQGMSGINQDVLPYALVGGWPAKLVSLNSVGLRRRSFSPQVRTAIKTAFKILKNADLNTSQAIEKIKSEIEMTDEIRYLIDFVKNSKRGFSK